MEDLLTRWCKSATQEAENHLTAGRSHRRSAIRWGLPGVLLPLAVAPLKGALHDVPYAHLVESVALVLSALCAAVENQPLEAG